MRVVAVCAILFALAFGCANCDTASRPAAGGGSTPATDGAPVIVIDNVPLKVLPSTRVEPGGVSGDDVPTSIEEPPAAGLPPTRPPRPVRSVVVDPGHGGDNTGATGGGLEEKDINLDVAKRLAEALRRRGLTATLTRTEDVFVALEERAETANVAGADLFISLHSNAAPNPDACGIEVFYPAEVFRQNGLPLRDDARARDIATRLLRDGPMTYDGDLGGLTPETLAFHRDLGRTLGLEIERAMTRTLEAPSRGVKPAAFEVLRWTACPAVLVEMAFMTNDGDLEKLSDPGYRERIAGAIADAVVAYAGLAPPGGRE